MLIEAGVDLKDPDWVNKLGRCSNCGCYGLHACTGKLIPTPTPEDENRLRIAIDKIFGHDEGKVKNFWTDEPIAPEASFKLSSSSVWERLQRETTPEQLRENRQKSQDTIRNVMRSTAAIHGWTMPFDSLPPHGEQVFLAYPTINGWVVSVGFRQEDGWTSFYGPQEPYAWQRMTVPPPPDSGAVC